MKYRALSTEGDYCLGNASADWLKDAEAVTQAVKTRLLLFQNEWWEDLSEGLPFWTGIAGQAQTEAVKNAADLLVQDRILGTPGVRGIVDYASEFGDNRSFAVTARLNTIYGDATLEVFA